MAGGLRKNLYVRFRQNTYDTDVRTKRKSSYEEPQDTNHRTKSTGGGGPYQMGAFLGTFLGKKIDFHGKGDGYVQGQSLSPLKGMFFLVCTTTYIWAYAVVLMFVCLSVPHNYLNNILDII